MKYPMQYLKYAARKAVAFSWIVNWLKSLLGDK